MAHAKNDEETARHLFFDSPDSFYIQGGKSAEFMMTARRHPLLVCRFRSSPPETRSDWLPLTQAHTPNGAICLTPAARYSEGRLIAH